MSSGMASTLMRYSSDYISQEKAAVAAQLGVRGLAVSRFGIASASSSKLL
jgi:hypothetical protein